MLDEGKVNQFAMKWLEKYQSEKTMEFEVEEGFGEECFSLGFKMDCGNAFETGSTKESLRVDVCSNCHPFYTGQQRNVAARGRVEQFNRRYGAK